MKRKNIICLMIVVLAAIFITTACEFGKKESSSDLERKLKEEFENKIYKDKITKRKIQCNKNIYSR